MAGRFQIDHVVIKVTDLDRAMADYEALGFSVVRGGEHPMWGSRNALVCFADGSYLELIAYGAGMPKEGLARHEARMLSRAQVSDGLVDYAVLPELGSLTIVPEPTAVCLLLAGVQTSILATIG